MIPKIIHQIWIGDQSKRPTNFMKTWQKNHPDWSYKIWTEKEIEDLNLINKEKFDIHPTLPGKSDIARYEILLRYGGFYIDADSISIRKMNNLRELQFVAAYESERHRPGLVANGYIGCQENSKIMFDMVAYIRNMTLQQASLPGAWKTLGPLPFTHFTKKHELNILNSNIFMPVHFADTNYIRPRLSLIDQKLLDQLKEKYKESYSYQFWASQIGY